MIHFVITAGGTEEDIDGVRKITNFSTGNLGWLILETMLKKMDESGISDFHIHYIHGKNAMKRELEKSQTSHVTFLPVTDAQSTFETVCNVLQENHIDFFIHSMAVSDFSFSYAVNTMQLALELSVRISGNPNLSVDEIEEILQNPTTKYSANHKISSSDSIFIALKPAPKIISLIKQLSPKTYLIGFKLLRNVSEEELLQTAQKLAENNSCDAVLANDLSSISENSHKAFLLKENKIIGEAVNKKAVAEMIVNHCFENIKPGV